MMETEYDDTEKETTTSNLQQDPSDEVDTDEVSDDDSFESFQSPTASLFSDYSRGPYLEIEEINEGLIQFSRTTSSKSSVFSFNPNQPVAQPPSWRRNWIKWLFGQSTSTVPKVDMLAPIGDQLKTLNMFDKTMETISFDHHGYDGIKKIIICCDLVINSITIQYTKHGKLEWTDKVGGDGGEHFEIVLDDPDEYIMKVTGGYCALLYGVCFLTFFSNRRTYGPFGLNNGTLEEKMRDYLIPFECSGGKLVGLKGTAGVVSEKLSSIGFSICSLPQSYEKYEKKSIDSTTSAIQQIPNSNETETITMGKWGYLKDGLDEMPFDHHGYDGIKRIILYCGLVIYSIRVQYTKHGELEWTKKVGGDGGHRYEIVLDGPDEYIVKVMGKSDLLESVNSLTFFSNRKTYGPFGLYQGCLEEEMMDDLITFGYSGGKLVGIKGTEGIVSKKLSSIGFNVCSLPQSYEKYEKKSIVCTASVIHQIPIINQVHCKIQQISVEPFGYSHSGSFFNHGTYDGIKRIFISHGRWINSFMVEYMKNGQPQMFKKVGQKGKNAAKVVLDYPYEFIHSVTGHYLMDRDSSGIASLTFHSNVRKYGPFGNEEGQLLEVSGCKIVGFQGRVSEERLYAIGFHVVPSKSPLFCL